MNQSRTMKEVVAALRANSAEALLDLFELHIAVGELVLNARVLSRMMDEFAAELADVAEAPPQLIGERVKALAVAATRTGEVAAAHARALVEIQRGLDAWRLTAPAGLRVV